MVRTCVCLTQGRSSILRRIVVHQGRNVHFINGLIMNAIDAVKAVYDLEDCKEIVSHGCESGVCFQHVYYGDTTRFYDNNEDEVLDYLTDQYDTEFLVDLFRDADADLTHYKNAVCWAFIELVAMEAVQDYNHEYAQANLTMEPV